MIEAQNYQNLILLNNSDTNSSIHTCIINHESPWFVVADKSYEISSIVEHIQRFNAFYNRIPSHLVQGNCIPIHEAAYYTGVVNRVLYNNTKKELKEPAIFSLGGTHRIGALDLPELGISLYVDFTSAPNTLRDPEGKVLANGLVILDQHLSHEKIDYYYGREWINYKEDHLKMISSDDYGQMNMRLCQMSQE